VVAVVLGIEMFSLLVGEAASPQEQAAIRRTLASTPGIAQLLQLHTMHLSPDELLVVAKVEMDPDLSADNVARVIDAAQARVRQAVPSARVVYLEPDLPVAASSGHDSGAHGRLVQGPAQHRWALAGEVAAGAFGVGGGNGDIQPGEPEGFATPARWPLSPGPTTIPLSAPPGR